MLKATAVSIAPQLCTIFNLSLTTGVFPSDWKIAWIVPVPKGSDKSQPSGYRPISILPIISKVMEKHVKALLDSHLQQNAPISPRQWGFMSSRSTVSALINVIDYLSQALDQGYEVCIVFFDISKTLDAVPHLSLLETLKELNVNPYLLRWINSYLLHRSQFVSVDNSNSHILPVTTFVPQGSVLGPVLFIYNLHK